MALTQISTQGIKDGTITGSDLATNVDLVDNQKLRFGTGNDLEIYHSGIHSYIENDTGQLYALVDAGLIINQVSSAENIAKFIANGGVELYHNNSKKFETDGNGITVQGNINMATDSTFFLGVGNDFKLFHNGTSNFIRSANGNIRIDDNSGVLNAQFIPAGASELYNNGSKKFFTTSNGVQATNRIIVGEGTAQRGLLSGDANSVSIGSISDIPLNFNRNSLTKARIDGNNFQIPNDNGKIELGASQDLQIYHSGSGSFIVDSGTGDLHIRASDDLKFETADGSETYILCNQNSSVDLYHDNSKKFETTSVGASITGQLAINNTGGTAGQGELAFGESGRPFIEAFDSGNHGSGAAMNFRTGAGEYMARMKFNGAVELYYNNVKKFETNNDGVAVTGDLNLGSGTLFTNDNGKLRLGGGQDLQIYHDGTASYIAADDLRITNKAVSETLAKFIANDAVELYHNDSKKFETTSGGVDITGDLNLSGGGNTALTINTGNNSGDNSSIFFADSADADVGYINYDHGTNKLQIAVGASLAATIDSSANLGVGSANPNRGSHSRSITLSNTATSARSAVEIEGNTANCHAALEFYNNGTLVSGLNSRGSDRLQFVTGSSGTVRGQFTSNGLNFGSDTAAANALDDYEEGTYTPNVQTNNGVNAGVSTAFGSYVKVGTLVTVHIGVTTNSHSGVDTSAQYRVYLPFTAANQSGVGTEGNLICSQWSIGNQNISWMGGEVQNGFNFIYMHYHNGSNNNTNNLTPSAASNELHFRGTCVYRAAS